MLPYEPCLKQRARQLRKQMTDSERMLWSRLRAKQIMGIQFFRQKPIGPYIVDFFAARARLVIEVDGGQHFNPADKAKDRARDGYLRKAGLIVLRFDNRQVMLEIEGVLKVIYDTVLVQLRGEIPPDPPLKRGEPKAVPLKRGEPQTETLKSYSAAEPWPKP